MRRAISRVRRASQDDAGFTLIEVLVATLVLVTGLLALFGMVIVADKTTATNRVRQAGTSLAREVVEDARSLAYTQLTPAALPAAIQAQLVGSTLSGSTLSVTRSISGDPSATPYTFTVSFSVCSLDDPGDGYGDHSQPPASGGSWCPDVGPSGTADTTPDDYKRLSVTVTPTGHGTMPTVQQTVMLYEQDTHGPAVSCLSTTASCPGANETVTSGTSLTFNVTTTQPAAAVQWLVNGNPPTSGQLPAGGADPYTPSGVTSQFTWDFPMTGTQTIDGTYSITALGLDANGRTGTRSTLQVTLDEHDAIPPGGVNAGWDEQINQGQNGGGVDVQWKPSVDQDILYYRVYRQSGTGSKVIACDHVTGTSCTDLSAPSPGTIPTDCTTSSATPDYYWVVGFDTDPATGRPRESAQESQHVNANLCNHHPNAPYGLQPSIGSGGLTLSWSAPTPGDPDTGDSIVAWRIYRWSSGSMQDPGNRLNLVGSADGSGNSVTTFTDHSPDPGGVAQNYCVTAVDTHLDESPCSTAVTG